MQIQSGPQSTHDAHCKFSCRIFLHAFANVHPATVRATFILTCGGTEASRPRQIAAAKLRALASGDNIAKVVSEIVSGSLPLARRTGIVKLIEQGNVKKNLC